jgi:dihydropteroate synthase
MLLRARQYQFRFPGPAQILGIVNVTPDSFSDGGKHLDPSAAVDRALELEAEGAGMIDIGGESTRPQAQPVEPAEELRRVMPVIERLAGRLKVPLSIDTMKPAVARAALAAGASMVNDVGANQASREMAELVAETGAAYVIMHMQGTPLTMQQHPAYTDVVAEVDAFFGQHLERLRALGVNPEQVTLDVGIGFGKTLEHNLQLLGHLRRFTKWGRPLLLGVSRKSFIGRLLGLDVAARLPASLAGATQAVASGVQLIRTHDVAATVQAVRMVEAVLGSAETATSAGADRSEPE